MNAPLPIKNANVKQVFQAAVSSHVSGDRQGAVSGYHHILKIRPDYVPALNNLGAIYLQSGERNKAFECFNQAVYYKPDNVDAINNLGVLLNDSGDYQAAADFFQRALELNPLDAEIHANLGSALKALGQTAAAEACQNKAIAIDPCNPKAHNNLALLYKEAGDMDSAVSYLHAALKLDPDDEQIYFNIFNILVEAGRFEEAITVSETALSRFPESITTMIGSARVFIECGRWEKADPIMESVVHHPFTGSDQDILRHLLLFLHASKVKREDIARLHTSAGRLIQEKTATAADGPKFDFQNHYKNMDRLRIGYVSPDFNRHSVGYFFREIIKNHNRSGFDIFCYSLSDTADDITREIKEHAGIFRRVHHLKNIDIARQIHTDRIQILVDLAGYTRNNRLDLFALKPAPIQVTGIGYPHGSGLPAMDYRLTDPYADDADDDRDYTETLLRMPGCFLPFPRFERPDSETGHEQLGISKESVAFASFNAWHKLRPEVLCLWNQILINAPGTCIVFSFRGAETEYAQQRIRSYFTIDPKRLHFFRQTDTDIHHRARYAAVDISLDPFPYNGTTSSWEALYMGVPVITLKGERHVQRTTFTLLANLGLEMLVADRPSAYIETAVTLATDAGKRARIKGQVQQAVRKAIRSGNSDYVEALERIFCEIWRRYHQASG